MDTPFHVIDSKTDGQIHRFSVGLDGERVRDMVTRRLQQLSKTAQINGFRRGKAPLNVLRKRHGRKVMIAVVDRMAIHVARQLIAEQALKPVSRPRIEFNANEDIGTEIVAFTLVLELFPTISLRPVADMSIERLAIRSHDKSTAGGDIDQSLIRQHVKRQVFDELVKHYSFPVPAEMVEYEYRRIVESYRQSVEPDISQSLNDRFREIAERRIRLAVILVEVGRAHDISIPREEVERLVEARAEHDSEHEADIVNYYVEHPTALAQLQSTLFEDRVVDLIVQQAKVSERLVSAGELAAIVIDD